MDDKKFPETFFYIDIENDAGEKKTVYFMNRILNHDFYDSLISSGKINFLEPDLQRLVQDIFKRIKTHNEFLTAAEHMWDQQHDDLPPKRAYRYYDWMDKNEVRLKKEIPDTLKKLKEHFKIGPTD